MRNAHSDWLHFIIAGSQASQGASLLTHCEDVPFYKIAVNLC